MSHFNHFPTKLSVQKGHLQTLRRLALADPETMMCIDMNGYTACKFYSSYLLPVSFTIPIY